MKKIISIFFVLITLTACSPQKRLQRLVDTFPELKNTITKNDTIRFLYRDTLLVQGWEVDTFFSMQYDTVFLLQNDSVKLTVSKVDKERYRLNLIFPDKQINRTDTLRIPYIDTIQAIQYLPISSSDIWDYRLEGIYLIVGILFLVMLAVFISKVYI